MPRVEPFRLTPMFPRVTALLVVHSGGDRLRQTLDAIRSQQRTPDALVVVLTEADAEAREQIAAAGATHVVELVFDEGNGSSEPGDRPAECPDAVGLVPFEELRPRNCDGSSGLERREERRERVGLGRGVFGEQPERVGI
jgi:hypothetical protein